VGQQPLTVAIQGELGSNSELAALEYFGTQPIDILPCYCFADLFTAVEQGLAEAAMAPVENSLAGSIHDVWDLLSTHHPVIAGEIRLRIVHCLIGLPGAAVGDVRRVRSHPQALAQCGNYLNTLQDVTVEAVYDTAGAVEIIKSENRGEEAAIASAQAARDHSMQILARDLSTADNFTRFLVLGSGVAGGGSPKSTVILEMEHTVAALPAILGRLVAAGIEVLKVETHKRIGQPWSYGVYLEFAGGTDGPAAQALIEIADFVTDLQIVGTYPTGQAAEPRLHQR
jgi:prephenate dehydratase